MSNYPGPLSGGFISHRFQSLKPDQPDLSVVNATNWNQSHIIGSGALQSGAFGAWAITSGNLSSGSVIPGSASSGAVSSGALGANTVNSGNVNSGSVTYGTLASGVITSGLVASGAVQWVQLLNTSKPFVVVTKSGPSDGGDFGPGTTGTQTAGIKEAINSLSSGGMVFIGAGTYNNVDFATMTAVTATNTLIKGAGRDSTTIRLTGAIRSGQGLLTLYAFNFNAGGMEDITIDGSGIFYSGFGSTDVAGFIETTSGGIRPTFRRLAFNNATSQTTYPVVLGLNLFNGPYAVVDDIRSTNSDIALWVTRPFGTSQTKYQASNIFVVSGTNRSQSLYWEDGEADIDQVTLTNSTGVFIKTSLRGRLTNLTVDTNLSGGSNYGVQFSSQSSGSTSAFELGHIYIANTRGYGIQITNVNNLVLSDFEVKNAGLATANKDLIALTGCNDWVIVNGVCHDDQAAPTSRLGVYEYGSSTNGLIEGVDVANSSLASGATASGAILTASIGTVVKNCNGYSPRGILTAISSGTIGLLGTTTSVASGITYVVTGIDVLVTSLSGNPSIVVTGSGGGTAIMSGATSLTAQYLPVGSRISWGAFTSAPTVTVFGN